MIATFLPHKTFPRHRYKETDGPAQHPALTSCRGAMKSCRSNDPSSGVLAHILSASTPAKRIAARSLEKVISSFAVQNVPNSSMKSCRSNDPSSGVLECSTTSSQLQHQPEDAVRLSSPFLPPPPPTGTKESSSLTLRSRYAFHPPSPTPFLPVLNNSLAAYASFAPIFLAILALIWHSPPFACPRSQLHVLTCSARHASPTQFQVTDNEVFFKIEKEGIVSTVLDKSVLLSETLIDQKRLFWGGTISRVSS